MKVGGDMVCFRTKETRAFHNMYCWTREPLPPVCSQPNCDTRSVSSANANRVASSVGFPFALHPPSQKAVNCCAEATHVTRKGTGRGVVCKVRMTTYSPPRAAGNLLSRVQAPPPAPWSVEGPERLRSP
ncbi:hypothetical protein PoB_000137000 [Plakobranchus ocellatus]|uniref:Uncharacterized protein n=1 Tax=Plakobranchus ocellatus TaxID=259542 RepID=A0AAV3XW77_9GAST|nr:hypothetical protein PoB_000137000 [Plakobranchus ocellatus]